MRMTKLKIGAMALGMLGLVVVTGGMLAIAKSEETAAVLKESDAKAEEKPKNVEGGGAESLTATIKLQKGHARIREAVEVSFNVVNTSESSQSFQVMNCSWRRHWKSSNDKVSLGGLLCKRNFAETVTLEPGDVYENTAPVFLRAGKLNEEVSFKMGFTSIDGTQTFWSNEATLTVEPPAKADNKP